MERYRASMLMSVLALICVAVHLWTGWETAVDEAATHGTSEEWSSYMISWLRDTFENLQSEFWQLAVQFALLAGFFEFMNVRAHEEDMEVIKTQANRIEAKLDSIVGGK